MKAAVGVLQNNDFTLLRIGNRLLRDNSYSFKIADITFKGHT